MLYVNFIKKVDGAGQTEFCSSREKRSKSTVGTIVFPDLKWTAGEGTYGTLSKSYYYYYSMCVEFF